MRRFHERVLGAASGLNACQRDVVQSREERCDRPAGRGPRALPKATVAGLCGHIVGPFFGLSLAFDPRLAAPDMTLSARAVDGVPAGGGLGFYLPHRVGLGRARQILLLGEELDLSRAQTLGLVTRVVAGPGPDAFADECRRLLAAGALAADARPLLRPFTPEQGVTSSWRPGS